MVSKMKVEMTNLLRIKLKRRVRISKATSTSSSWKLASWSVMKKIKDI